MSDHEWVNARFGRMVVAVRAAVVGLACALLAGCATMQFSTGERSDATRQSASEVAAATSTAPNIDATPTVTPPPALLSPSAPDPTATKPPAPVGAYVLGDSISLAVAPYLSRLGYPVVGKVGQSATDAYLRENLSTDQAQAALAWVIVLGTNNRGDATDVAAIPRWLNLIDDLRPNDIPVYWVTPYRSPSYTGGLSSSTLDAFNAELIAQSLERPWLGIVDYAFAASFHPEWFEADGEHLHPDRTGLGVLAAMIAGPDAVPAKAPAPVTSLGPTAAPATNEATDEPTTFTNVPVPTTSSPPPASPDPSAVAPAPAESPAPPAASPAPAAPSAPAASAAPAG